MCGIGATGQKAPASGPSFGKPSTRTGKVIPSAGLDRKSLLRRGLNGLKWNSAGAGARIGLQLVAQIVIARLIGPESFGLVATAMILAGVGSILVEWGLGSALIQKRELAPGEVGTVFTRIMIAAAVLAILSALLAEQIASAFDEPRLAPIVKWYSLAMVFQALGMVSVSLLRRELEMKALEVRSAAAYFCAYVLVGITLAVLGAGHWSLVAAWVTYNLLLSSLCYLKVRHTLRPAFGWSTEMTIFGSKVVATNGANFVLDSVASFLVAKLFGASAVGMYAVAHNLVRSPIEFLARSIQGVTFAASARAQLDTRALGNGFLATCAITGAVVFPTFTGIGLMSHPIIETLYGEAWVPAAALLLPLALAMPLHAITCISGPLLWGKGEVGREMKASVTLAVLLTASLLVASRHSITAMAWAVWLAHFLRAGWLLHQLCKVIGISWGQCLGALRPGAILAAIVAGVFVVLEDAASRAGFLPAQRLLLAIGAGGTIVMIGPLILGRALWSADVAGMFSSMASTARGPFGTVMRWVLAARN